MNFAIMCSIGTLNKSEYVVGKLKRRKRGFEVKYTSEHSRVPVEMFRKECHCTLLHYVL